MRQASLFILMLLAGCHQAPVSALDALDSAGAASGLERAAIDSGAITDTARTSPVGLFQRTHEAGRDALCIVPTNEGQLGFGMEASFGEEQGCRGRGHARRTGDKLILSFAGGKRCIIVAQYDGDQIALPGVADMACADLCDGRGNLEGVSFPRIAADASSALRARNGSGGLLCPPS